MDNEGKSMRPSGYWKNQDNFEREANEAIELNSGTRPTCSWLIENGFGSLVVAANSYHEGLTNAFDRVIGEETEGNLYRTVLRLSTIKKRGRGKMEMTSKKPKGYWKGWDNFEREVKEAIELNDGDRPNYTWLIENGYSGLASAVQKYYDGFTNVLDRVMGEKPTKIQKQIEKIVTNGLGYSNHLSIKGMNTSQDLQRHLLAMNFRVKYSDRK